ncbi:hypothetical protein SOVF_061450 [Spinacia oleracea]|nr:hypothetical protein SOVF_061450 [Spinacia oleracea]
MSPKLVYAMSDENEELKKQIGCMNGLLQFFDPHHFINNPRVSPGETKQQGRAVNSYNKRSKDKHPNAIKEMQLSPIESSRISISSSSAISSSEYDWNTNLQNSPLAETARETSSPAKNHIRESVPTCASPISTALRYDLMHIDSPRLSHTSRPDSPRLAAHNQSFRSISSNHSAPVITPRNKDHARLSYDGRETRDTHISSLKLKDLPRLSLDSKQPTTKVSAHDSKHNLLLRNLKREEPASYRAPSNIVAKLMGLEALPDDTPSRRSLIQKDDSTISQTSEFLSTSSRTIDQSKVDRVLHSPRSNGKESRSNKDKSGKTSSPSQEAQSEPKNHPLTVYGAIEKRLADLDFQKSGKDLRALKQILEAMHKEKIKLEIRKENPSSHCASQTSNISAFHISQKQGPKMANLSTTKGFSFVKDVTSTENIKPTKLVKGSREVTTQVVQNIPITNLQRLRIVQPVDGLKDSEQKKTAKDLKETHHIRKKYSGERTPRPIRTSKEPQHMTKTNATSSSRIPDNRSSPATSGSRVKQSQQAVGFPSQNRKLPRNLSLLQEIDKQSSEFSSESICQSQQGNTTLLSRKNDNMVSHIHRYIENADELCMKYGTQVTHNKNSEGFRGDMALEELATTVREQPSPVSVLDANFFEDETPSPIRKKPTAFRDFETNTTYNEAEWIDTDLNHSPDRFRLNFNYESDYRKLENFKESAPSLCKLNSYQHGNLSKTTPLNVNVEKSYVSEVLLASGFLDHLDYTMADHLALQSQEAINPNLFFELEQTMRSSFVSDNTSNSKAEKMTRTTERHRRRLLFDAVNEILSQKLSQPPSPLLKKPTELATGGLQLLQEIYKEIDQVQPMNLPHNLDDEEDFLTTIIGKDLTHKSATWTAASIEIPALVLDIERLIFKDLIVELVQDGAAQVQAHKHRKK